MFRYLRLFIGLSVTTLGLASPAFGQRFPFKTYSIEEGLSQSVVLAILQDSKGYLWIGTADGLNRFDGLEFLHYGVADGLTVPSITSLGEDKDQNLMVGTEGGGVFLFTENRFHRFDLDKKEGEKKLNRNNILPFFKGETGDLYFANEAGEIYQIRDKEIVPVWSDTSYHTSKVKKILMGRNKTFWIATLDDGLIRLQNGKIEKFLKGGGRPLTKLNDLYLDGKGVLWIGTYDGLVRFDGSFRSFSKKEGLPNNLITALFEDQSGSLWVGTEGGICLLQNGECRILNKNNGLPVNAVYTIYQDRDAHMWFGTFGGGVSQLITNKFIHYTPQNGLTADLVFAISQSPKGEILIGTDGGGLNLLKDDRAVPLFPNHLGQSTLFQMIYDKKGAQWIATYDKGIFKNQNGKILNYSTAEGLPSPKVNSIFEDANGTLWIGTGQGAAFFEGDKIHPIESKYLNERIQDIHEDKMGHLWFAAASIGIVRLTNKKTTLFTTKEGLVDNYVYDIFEDKEGILWFATTGGLSRYENGHFKNYTTREGLSNNHCYFIIQDESGFYWIGTNRGLNRFDGTRFKTYTVQEGLLTNEFNSKAAFKDNKGLLWFGNIKGVTRLDPKLDVDNKNPPPVYITNIKIRDKSVTPPADSEFPHDENYIEFSFNSPFYDSPKDLMYRFKLAGLEQDWKKSYSREVQFTSLPPNRYMFQVRAVTKEGIESKQEASFAFTILPPFWMTSWFLTLAFLSGGLSLYGGYRYKVYQVQRRNRELEKVVHDRTLDLEEEKNKSETLLCNILPKDIVRELKATGHTIPKRYNSITILFADFKSFTTVSSTLPPENLIGELDEMFRNFDRIIAKHGLEKIKTIGDAYMAAGGLPVETENHAVQCVLAALEMQNYMKQRNKKSIIKWDMRVGIHSGTVVAGVVGDSKFTYDIWGDTVNIASRMETSCEPSQVNLSAFTYYLVKDRFKCKYRGKIQIKGKGEVDMYYLSSTRKRLLFRSKRH